VVIQALLVMALVGLLVVFTRREHGVRMQVGKRLAFVTFIGVTVYGVLRPDDLTRVANHVGVGRGADLLLYGLLVSAIFLVVNTGMRFRGVERQLTDLVRAIALQDAELRRPSGPGPVGERSSAQP
jgi:small membrane protein